jgi:hypothetical protein
MCMSSRRRLAAVFVLADEGLEGGAERDGHRRGLVCWYHDDVAAAPRTEVAPLDGGRELRLGTCHIKVAMKELIRDGRAESPSAAGCPWRECVLAGHANGARGSISCGEDGERLARRAREGYCRADPDGEPGSEPVEPAQHPHRRGPARDRRGKGRRGLRMSPGHLGGF